MANSPMVTIVEDFLTDLRPSSPSGLATQMSPRVA